jgi:Sulfotransferase domain
MRCLGEDSNSRGWAVKEIFFLGIGVQKCASTWLYSILLDHPQVALSNPKELDFFSYHFGRGYQWYEKHFPGGLQKRVFGEISPSYFIEGSVPERLKAYTPEAKILVSLRDPVERAISNHRHEVRLGHFVGDDLSFEAGLKNNPLYIEQSRYGTHLQRWLMHFPSSRILILFQEDIEKEPIRTSQRVYRFLGIDAGHVSSAVSSRVNESRVYRFQVLERVRKTARKTTQSLGIDGLWAVGQGAGLQSLYRRLNRRPPDTKIPAVSAATEERLRQLFEGEIKLVEEITGRALPQWR